MRPSVLLDDAARARIADAVHEAERHTSGEIVVCVARACDEYGAAGWRLGVGLAVMAFLGLMWWAPDPPVTPLLAFLGVEAAALLAGHALARLDPIRRLLVAESLMDERVMRRAFAAFTEHGLVRTTGRTGILLFVALLEHRVVVLGDEGIHRLLGPDESWDEVKELALGPIRGGRLEAGILAAVRRAGAILAAHAPGGPRPLDELPNALVLED